MVELIRIRYIWSIAFKRTIKHHPKGSGSQGRIEPFILGGGFLPKRVGGIVLFVGHKTDFIFHVLSFPGDLLFKENVVFVYYNNDYKNCTWSTDNCLQAKFKLPGFIVCKPVNYSVNADIDVAMHIKEGQTTESSLPHLCSEPGFQFA